MVSLAHKASQPSFKDAVHVFIIQVLLRNNLYHFLPKCLWEKRKFDDNFRQSHRAQE